MLDVTAATIVTGLWRFPISFWIMTAGHMSCSPVFLSSTLADLKCAPGFFFQREPLGRRRQIALGVRPVSGLELPAQARADLRIEVMPHCLINESAPFTFGHDAIKNRQGLVREDDIDALAHGAV